jgi:hypothetical protein
MIIPKLYGRLGNQCFQVAAAIAHAKKMKTSWRIPRATIDPRTWVNYFIKEVPKENISIYSTRYNYDESRHCFDPIPEYDSLTINGYFQCEKYFQDAKYEIGDALGFHCKKEDYIAIHVRRGDFVTDYTDKHPPLPLDYYVQAIEYMRLNGFKRFKIYSDDTRWCVDAFQHILTDNEFFYSNIKDPLADMRDMYNASGFIIANSTFSLFPALLRLDNPVTIAPAEHRWFGPGNAHLETYDLMPERFIKI